MDTINIILAGVGGQGLVLTTRIICEAALKAGLDFKSNDVVGLAQRGGKVYGTVRLGKKVYTPNIEMGTGDFLVAAEPLEGLRWSNVLKDSGRVILNTKRINPVPVMFEEAEYPENISETLEKRFDVNALDATHQAVEMGSIKVTNTVLIGILSRYLPIDQNSFEEALKENVPAKFIDLNIEAFRWGRSYE